MSVNQDVATVAARGTLITLLGNVIAVVVGAIGVLVTASVLTPAEYGQYSLALLPLGLLNLLTGWGIDQALPRFLVHGRTRRESQELRDLIYAVLVFKGFTSGILMLVQFALAQPLAQLLNRPDIAHLIQISAFGGAVQPLVTTILTIFTGLDQMTRRVLIALLQTSTKAFITPTLVFLGMGVAGAAAGHIISFYLAVAIGLGALLVLIEPPRSTEILNACQTQVPRMIRFGFPLFMGTLISNVITHIQVALLPWYVSNTLIGNYHIAIQFTSLLTVFTNALGITLYPSFSKFTYRLAPARTREAFQFATRYCTLVVIPFTFLLIVVAHPIITTIYATKYPEAPMFFTLLLLPSLFMGLSHMIAPAFFTSQGDTRGTTGFLLLRAGFELALAPIGLITGGVVGFIVAHIIAQAVGVMYVNLRLRHKFQTHPDYRAFLKLLGSALGASAIALASGFVGILPASVLLVTRAFIFLVALLILLPITGAITREDLRNMRRFSENLSIIGVIVTLLIRIEHGVMQVTPRRS